MKPEADFDLHSFLPYLLNRAAEETSLNFQKVYKDRYGMLRTEWRVLVHLGRYGAMTATEIGKRADLHKTKISRAVARLSERGFLVRKEDGADRRQELLELSRTGQAAYRDLSTAAQEHNAELASGMTDSEYAVLLRCLKALTGR
ncbi:MAG: MarR family transcriptional regulator [Albidovulum sp.]|uniref:MarR family winged helix-turn-helix transcriptional regulator n=1 Tax=Albidovulum sp. TaxID=1872424 RepID=UPI003CC0A6BD